MKKNIDFATVADLYDLYVQWDVDIPFFLSVCEPTHGDVLELMCGTGRVSLPLIRAGVRLTCVDYSAEMLEVLRNRLREARLNAPVREDDVRTMNLDRRFDLILVPFHSFSEILGVEERASALVSIRRHLQPKGRLVITLHNPIVRISGLDGQRRLICERSIPGRDAVLRVWSTGKYLAAEGLGDALQEYEVARTDGSIIERRTLTVRFALPDRPEFERELRSVGFRIRQLWGDYNRNPFDPERSPYMVWELDVSGADQLPVQPTPGTTMSGRG